jgi:methyltransferase (TIGR00027 family)
MSDSLIQDVSDTAFMVATYRAIETARPDALFRNPLAAKLSGEHGERIVEDLPQRARLGRWVIAIRTCIIDAFIEKAIADGVDTVLNLGAGLDTRPYRMRLPSSLRWMEVDYPKIIALKESRLAGDTPSCRLERVKLDLADEPARRALFAAIAAQSTKVLVLTEGVIPYLTTDEVGSLADDLLAQSAFRYWVIDYLSPFARRWRERMGRKMKMENAPFRFAPGDWLGFFTARGWKVEDMRYLSEEADRLGRQPQFLLRDVLWAALRRLAFGKGQLEAFRKSSAYVLLERADAGRD